MKTKTTKLWLVNTCWIPDYEAYVLCRTALEAVERGLTPGEKLEPIKVKLTNTRHAYCGRAHWHEWETVPGIYVKRHWLRVLVRIGLPTRFPRNVCYPNFKDMPEYRFETYREALVGVTAHEAAHTLGYSGRKEGEFKCEMVTWDAVDYYRKHQVEVDAEIERYRLAAAQRAAKVNLPETPQVKAEKNYMKVKVMLEKWERHMRVARNKVKKYSRSLRRAEKRLPKGSVESEPLVVLPIPAAASSIMLAAAMPPPSPGPAQTGPAQ